MDWNTLIAALLAALLGGGGAAGLIRAWYGRRDQEIKAELQIVQSSADFVEDMRIDNQSLRKSVNDLAHKYDELRSASMDQALEISSLKHEVKTLRRENEQLRKENAAFRKAHGD